MTSKTKQENEKKHEHVNLGGCGSCAICGKPMRKQKEVNNMEKGQTLVELLSLLIIVGVFISICLVPFIRLSSTGKGVHNGYITAIEQEGYFFPNYRIYVKTDNSSSQEDVYCMDRSKTDLAAMARQYSKDKTRVDVSFEGVRGFGLGLCQDVQVIDVEPAK